jgi:hypothetical protein
MSEHPHESTAPERRSADQCQPAASQHPLSDAQLGGIRRHLKHVLSFSPIPIQQPDATHRVADEWAKAILGLGGVLHWFGLADEVRRDRPAPADTWLPWSKLKTAELAHFVLCLAVDHAEGKEIWRWARLADKVENPRHPVPPAERERAPKLIVDARDGWIAEILANGALLTDDPTFRRFTDGLRRHVERLLPQPAETAVSDRQRDILQVLFEKKAFDIDHRMTTDAIRDEVEDNERGKCDSFKRPIANLKGRGLIDTKDGRNGGCWLTDAGREYIKQARKL